MSTFEAIYRFFGWGIINIDNYFLMILLIGAVLLFFNKRLWGKGFIIWACLGFAFIGIVPVGVWTVVNLENRFPKLQKIPSDAKGMILLGGSFDILTTEARDEPAYNLTA